MMLKIIYLITLLSFINHSNTQDLNDLKIVCRDEFNGQPVDWFTLYKLPKKTNRLHESRKKSNSPFISQGTAYTYMTSVDQEWHLSNLSINDTQSLPGKTLELLYTTNFTDNPSIGYILYNDQADKVTVIKGHTKGVILFDENSAVWIVHSIPHYPPKPIELNYFIRPSQCVFGQSMLCMSFKFNELEKIGKQMLFNNPQIYDFYLPDNLKMKNSEILSNLISVVNGQSINQEPWFNLELLTTVQDQKMMSISKSTDFQDDLYSGVVVPSLKSSLLTETWNNGAGTIRSNCTTETEFNVLNIESVRIDVANLKFSVHNDHSKWAVSYMEERVTDYIHFEEDGQNESNDLVKIACLGDINRQKDQFKRAGGTVCFMDNENVWSEYHKLVSDIEECERVKMNKFSRKKLKSNKTKEKLIMLG